MKYISHLLLLVCLVFPYTLKAQQTIWSETFSTAEKGFWGGGSDMAGISKWTLDASACTLVTTSDFIKTVTTGGGRMQAVNIDGEAVWKSEIIDISSHSNIELSVQVSETGTSTNTNKYVRIYYSLNGSAEIPFDLNGQNTGNFGSLIAKQTCLNGNSIQITVRLNNPNSGDATIFDNVLVKYDDVAPSVLSVFAASTSVVKILFSEQIRQTEAETVGNYNITGIGQAISATIGADLSSVELTFPSNFIENQPYTINISNIADRCGNTISPNSLSFTYKKFKFKNAYLISKNEIVLEFSMVLNESIAETKLNYTINGGIGNPSTAVLESDSLVRLNFANSLTNNSAYTLTINNLKDLNGNLLEATNYSFTFHQAEAFDLVINEIMADPSPVVALPEFEYLELYNKSAFNICILNWKIKIGETIKTIPLKNLEANSYLIVSSVAGSGVLKSFGETIGILGSTDLTNSGKEIALISNSGLKVDSINYSDQWYHDIQKADGGWSIERIDPENTCGKTTNWKASVNQSGGTPGKINSVDNENIDIAAPEIITAKAPAANQINLNFSEELDKLNALNLNNYLVDGSIKPETVSFANSENNSIILVYSADFSLGNHQLQITNMKDICGNVNPNIETNFTYYPGNEFNIIINEIMVDINPEPNVIPPAKYIELYNNTDFNIDISGWTLQIGDNSPSELPDFVINAKSYLILCAASEQTNFEAFGNALGMLSESELLIGGTPISVYNAQGILIDYVNYSDSWYADAAKSAGGWSLERIDATNYCGDAQNWKASVDFKGGTPGHENSVKSSNPDQRLPVLKRVKVLLSNTLALSFSKNIVQNTAFNISNYILDNGSNLPALINFTDSSRTTLIIQFTNQFIDSQEQSIRIQNLEDFCGNQLQDTTVKFSYYRIYPTGIFAENSKILHILFSEEGETLSTQTTDNYLVNNGFGNPTHAYKHTERKNEVYLEFPDEFTNGNSYTIHIENIKDLNSNSIKPVDLNFTYFAPSFNDLVINEILFNPKPNGFDFVEIYNKSGHDIDLSKLNLANRNDDGTLSEAKVLSLKNLLLASGHYLAITSDTSKTKNDYPSISYDNIIQIPSMPSYNDDKGVVVLLFGDTIIDELAYTDNMHFALLTNTEGISLERIDPEKSTQTATNWHSAAENIGFATPANQNSQFHHSDVEINDEITVEPETFSPNNDGFEDQVFIHYKFSDPGFVANVTIYDAKGLIMKKIASNEMLGIEGEFSWDGLREDNSKARIGIYLIYFEVFNLKGEVKKFKKVCVLAGRLD